jgi:hypothetical protein
MTETKFKQMSPEEREKYGNMASELENGDSCPMPGCKGKVKRGYAFFKDEETDEFTKPARVLSCNRKRCGYNIILYYLDEEGAE